MHLNEAQKNHLLRLLGWVRCEIGQAPDEMVQMVRSLAPALGTISEEGKARLVQSHADACNVPKYVRQAVKQLSEAVLATKQTEVGDSPCASATKSVDRSLPKTRNAKCTAQLPGPQN